jgi:hypothetical protein
MRGEVRWWGFRLAGLRSAARLGAAAGESRVHEEDVGLQGCGLWRGLARRPITLRIEFVELDAGTDFDSQDFGLRRGLVQRPTTLRNEQCCYYHC